MRNLKFNNVVIISLLLSFGILFSMPRLEANAQNFSSGVNPSIIKIKAKSPSSVKSPIILQNSSDQNITYNIFLRPFKANSDLSGEPNFDPALNNEYNAFFNYVKIYDAENEITEITLAPNEKKVLALNIDINETTETRDYYFTVVFLSRAIPVDKNKNSIYSRGGIGTNVLLSVGSKSKSDGRIAVFTSPNLVEGGPISFDLELANHSNSFVTSKGNIIIKNMLGQVVGNIEIKPTNILANSNKSVSNSSTPILSWDQRFMLGIYKADLNVALSDDGPLLTQTKTFIAIPYKAILIVVSVILLIIWLTTLAKNKKNKE